MSNYTLWVKEYVGKDLVFSIRNWLDCKKQVSKAKIKPKLTARSRWIACTFENAFKNIEMWTWDALKFTFESISM